MMTNYLPATILLVLFVIAAVLSLRFIRGKWPTTVAIAVSALLLVPSVLTFLSWHFWYWFTTDLVKLCCASLSLGAIELGGPQSVAFGILCGIFTRVLTRNAFKHRKIARLILVAAWIFVGYVAEQSYVVLGLYIHQHPPSDECRNSTLYFTIGGYSLKIPANSYMLMYTGPKSTWTTYASFADWPMRELCQSAGDARNPFRLADLAFVFSLVDQYGNPSGNFTHKICETAYDPATKQSMDPEIAFICAATAKSTPEVPRRLTSLDIFQPDMFHPSEKRPSLYSAFLEDQAAAAKKGQPWTMMQQGFFDRYPNGYYIAHNAGIPGIGTQPATVHCKNTKGNGWVECKITRDLSGGLQGEASFTTPESDVDLTAVYASEALPTFLSIMSDQRRP